MQHGWVHVSRCRAVCGRLETLSHMLLLQVRLQAPAYCLHPEHSVKHDKQGNCGESFPTGYLAKSPGRGGPAG